MSQQDSPVMRRGTHRLTLDSQQDQRLQQQQQKRRQEKRLKKQEKKRRRQQAERQAQESAIEAIINQQPAQQYKDQGNDKLDKQDSDQGISFERVCEKIKKNYPTHHQKQDSKQQKKQKQKSKKRERTPSQSSQQEQSESEKSPKKQKKVQKVKKIDKKPQKKRVEEPKAKVKIQEISSKKQHLIQQVAKRWWFALPQWPPHDFDYDNQLSKIGFRCVSTQKFALQPEIQNGLHKVHCIQGFPGVYKSKFKLVDVRPKDDCPSLQYFMNMQSDKLRKLLKVALQKQIQELKT